MWGRRQNIKSVIGPAAAEEATRFGGDVIEGIKGQAIMSINSKTETCHTVSCEYRISLHASVMYT